MKKNLYVKPKITITIVENENHLAAMSATVTPPSTGNAVQTEWDAVDQELSFDW